MFNVLIISFFIAITWQPDLYGMMYYINTLLNRISKNHVYVSANDSGIVTLPAQYNKAKIISTCGLRGCHSTIVFVTKENGDQIASLTHFHPDAINKHRQALQQQLNTIDPNNTQLLHALYVYYDGDAHATKKDQELYERRHANYLTFIREDAQETGDALLPMITQHFAETRVPHTIITKVPYYVLAGAPPAGMPAAIDVKLLPNNQSSSIQDTWYTKLLSNNRSSYCRVRETEIRDIIFGNQE